MKKNIIDKIDLILRETIVSGDVATNTAKGHVTVIGAPPKKRKRKVKKSKLTGKNIVTQR